MANVKFDKEITALLIIDPYNDFISQGGKVGDRLKIVAEAIIVSSYVASPECCAEGGASRLLCATSSIPSRRLRVLEVHCACPEGSVVAKKLRIRHVGGEIRREFEPQPGKIVALEHWGSSGFANTDLDLQLKKHGIHQLIVMVLIAHTCVEATVRCAAELGYDVIMVKDATADYSDEEMHAALDVNIPN
jgi:ureidoacrylate peracid hydrolase